MHRFFRELHPSFQFWSTCERRKMWTNYKSDTVREWVCDWSSHRVVWLKQVEVKRHAGVRLIHKGLLHPMAKEGPRTTKAECTNQSPPVRSRVSLHQLHFRGFLRFTDKNIAVCSLFSIGSLRYPKINQKEFIKTQRPLQLILWHRLRFKATWIKIKIKLECNPKMWKKCEKSEAFITNTDSMEA